MVQNDLLNYCGYNPVMVNIVPVIAVEYMPQGLTLFDWIIFIENNVGAANSEAVASRTEKQIINYRTYYYIPATTYSSVCCISAVSFDIKGLYFLRYISIYVPMTAQYSYNR